MSPKVEIRESAIHGRGMFAASPLTAGEVVVVWGGALVYVEAAELARAEGKLVMQLDDNLYSVEERGEDRTYFMNHSCDPNVWMTDAVTLAARRSIPTGEELTVDYALFEAAEDFTAAWECACGSNVCRKQVTGRDWRRPALQERYVGHFLPLIARRIVRMGDPTATRVAGVMIRDGRVLLVHRSPSKRFYPDVWDLFGGHVEAGESPEEALRREAREELGIEVRVARWLGQIHDPVEPAAVDVYAVSSWEGEPVNAAPEEHTQVRWFGAGELPASAALDAYGALLVTALRGVGREGVPRW